MTQAAKPPLKSSWDMPPRSEELFAFRCGAGQKESIPVLSIQMLNTDDRPPLIR